MKTGTTPCPECHGSGLSADRDNRCEVCNGRGFIREVPLEISEAIDRLKQAIHSDPEYAWTWQSNVAMAAYDEGLELDAANRAAARFMMMLFGVNMRLNPHFADTQREAKKR